MPVIDRDKCDGCGLCVEVCACNAVVKINGSIEVIESDLCGWCTQCEVVCPRGAITCAFEIVMEETSE